MKSSQGCVHRWELGSPSSVVRDGDNYHSVDGVCSLCGASRRFETNMDALDREARKFMFNRPKSSPRQVINDTNFTW